MAPPPQSGGQSDNSYGMLWGVAAIFAAMGFIWYAFKKQIVSAFLVLKWYEADGLSTFFPAQYDPIKAHISAALLNPTKLTFSDLLTIGQQVGDYLRYPFIAILFLLAIILYLGSV